MLPKNIVFPEKFRELLDKIKVHKDVYLSNELIEACNVCNVEKKKSKSEYKSSVYIPKWNTFEPCDTLNLHVERGDEAFEPLNNQTNIVRSKTMTKQLGLTLQDVKLFMQNTEYKDDLALFNYAHLDQWNDEELEDIQRELVGEREELVLTWDGLLQESKNRIKWMQDNQKKESDDNFDDFKTSWMRYLVFIHMYKQRGNCSDTLPEEFNYAPTITPSPEIIGALSDLYWIPWKTYPLNAQIIIPFNIVSIPFTVELPKSISDTSYKIKGFEVMGHHEEVLKLRIQEMEMSFGKKSKFYENEKILFSNKVSDKDKKMQEIRNLMEKYNEMTSKREKLMKVFSK